MLVSKAWELQRKIWEHMNIFVHKGSRSLHEYELEAVDNVLRYEFVNGKDELSATYTSMFHGDFKRLIIKDVISKLHLLYFIWILRDKQRRGI